MISLKGFEYLIVRSGGLVFLDYEETIAFSRAEGRFTSPDRIFANVRVITPGLVTEVYIINIGGTQWETNLLTEGWQPTDPRYSFNPSLLFDAESGIPSILEQDILNPVLLGLEELPEIPGKKLYAIEATMQGNRAYEMSYGMIDKDTLQVRIWVEPGTFDLHRVILIDPANPGDEEDTIWQIDFWNFDKTFEIEPPVLDNE